MTRQVLRKYVTAALVLMLAQASQAQTAALHLARAKQAASAGLWHQVEQESRLQLRQQPGSEASAVLHAQALFHLSQPFDAVLELQDFLKCAPNSVEVGKFYVALLVDVVRDRPKALEVALQLSKLAPKDPGVWETLGKLKLGFRKTAEAVQCLSEAVRLAPANALFAVELAQSLEQDQQQGRAAAQFQRALKLNEASRNPRARVYTLYADFLTRSSRFKESSSVYSKALGVDPHDSDAWQGRALAYEKTGDLRNAEADAVAALRESPQRKDSHQILLRVYRATDQQEKLVQQVAIVEKLTEQEQADYSLNREMKDALAQAETLLAARQYAQAIVPYEKVVSLSPDFYEAYFALGVCYQQTGQTGKAEESLRRYISFQPLSEDGHAALGLLLFAAGRGPEARPQLEQAIRLNPSLAEPRKALARLSSVARDYDSAWKLLQPILSSKGAPDAGAFALAAQIRFSSGARQQALETCEAGLRAFPGDSALEQLHASLLLDCGATDACKAQALARLKQSPTSAAYLKLVAELLIDKSAIDPSTTDVVAQMMRRLPKDPGALYLHAKWALASNQLDISLQECKRLAADPAATPIVKARGLALMALAYARSGRSEEASEAFKRALDLDRSLEFPDPEVGMTYVEFLLKAAQDQAADDLVSEILIWAPDYAPARLRRAVRLANTGHAEAAVRDAQLALLHGDDLTVQRAAHVLLAKTYSSLDRPADAKIHMDWINAH